jgi:hypothetical protein
MLKQSWKQKPWKATSKSAAVFFVVLGMVFMYLTIEAVTK